ncbi:brain-specific angiogenesis inhibitor 1-associated protein 2-like protein 1 isoform X8 [Tachysurus fulvidraco]|uniref:brain-specific angiogenesis inhibitor 1-associated protein 2-like protein 1 isoform X8 n=1 Tax=Tachysurus fulvidraco TaxID=1234273 RepID=UPI000F50F760|nr:brain-specific angiogenesis inhibitor 1-associated protein 2-like protein 1 isoform X8 [Tachysurus fulvidraco]
MVVTGTSKMSRADEVHRITENVYKSIMEQFNPCLRNFVAMGKTYEKALSSVTFAAKGYFDALVRMGELASESHGSKDLEEAAWDVLFQMAEVHRQIQMQLEDMLKSFHNELLTELEKKVELDARYLNAALKKYQMEHRSKGESLEKCQAELKKLRRKSQQGSKNASKYRDNEMQYVEAISSRQSELDSHIAEGYKNALTEERRRYCFLVDRQCALAKSTSTYHTKRMMGMESVPMLNGTAGAHGGEDYQHWMDSQAAQAKSASTQVHRNSSEIYSNTLPVRKVAPTKSKSTLAETQTLPRSSSVTAGLERNGRTRVQAIFSHSAGDNNTLLSFTEGDIITLLVPEARDGWHYGESEKTRMRGWFPFSYTRVIPETDGSRLGVSFQHGRSSSTGNLLERDPVIMPSPDYGSTSRQMGQNASLGRHHRTYSVATPGFSQPGLDSYEARFPTSSEVKLISTV